METKQIHLERITYDNVGKVLKLRVARDQKHYLGSNEQSLALAYATLSDGDPVFPFAIYHGKTPVGFIMIDYDDDWTGYGRDVWLNSEDYKRYQGKPFYYIWRFMIDRRYQGKGYGRQAFRLALDFVRTLPCGPSDICWLSYEPENEAAKKLYASFGFVEAPEGYVEGEEMPAILKL